LKFSYSLRPLRHEVFGNDNTVPLAHVCGLESTGKHSHCNKSRFELSMLLHARLCKCLEGFIMFSKALSELPHGKRMSIVRPLCCGSTAMHILFVLFRVQMLDPLSRSAGRIQPTCQPSTLRPTCLSPRAHVTALDKLLPSWYVCGSCRDCE
jgi:hypothetical protein